MSEPISHSYPASTHPTPPRPTPPRPPDSPQPLAAILALLIPGAGHFSLGHTRRGILIALSIFGLFFGGLFIGGMDAVDSQENRIWFFGQALIGPTAFVVDTIHQKHFKVLGPTFKDVDSYPALEGADPTKHYAERYQSLRNAFVSRGAAPYEIRDPKTAQAIIVRDPRPNHLNEPLTFTDPATGQTRLSTLEDRPPYVQSLGRASELGTLFATIAGMMNLICVIDAAYHHRREKSG